MMDLFDFIDDKEFDVLNNLYRFNGLRTIKQESVAHHTFFVVLFSRLLAEDMLTLEQLQLKLAIMDYALLHDFGEMYSYDIVYPVKYNSFNGKEIKKSIEEYEKYRLEWKFKQFNEKRFLNSLLEENSGFIKDIVKVADWLSCLFFISKEIKLGNTGVIDEYKESLSGLMKSCQKLLSYSLKNMTIVESIILKSNKKLEECIQNKTS